VTAQEPQEQPAASGTQASVDRATAITEDLIDRGVPWGERTTWRIVLGEAIVAGLVGLLFLFKPFGGASMTLQIIGLILLGGALITSFQVWRHSLRPERENLASFRAGAGVTVGLVVIVATFFTDVTDAVTTALAVVVGIGFIVFGLAGIAAGFVGRTTDESLPLASLVANTVLAVAGAVLMVAGALGSSTVDDVFVVLGILLIVAGLALAGYAYLLRQREVAGSTG
jgi:uncharacterized membrane protein HdeD (DUF308 family)